MRGTNPGAWERRGGECRSDSDEREDRVKLSMTLNYAGGFEESARQAVALEKVGLDIVWVAEAYSFDAPSFMGFLAAKTERVEIGSAILPIYSRTPTLIAMTAAGVDAVSGGRCVLGLGASGPQVIEGFHGVPYDRPLTRTREIIDVCRQVWAREGPLFHEGAAYHIPLPPGEGTGLGKPLKLINHPVRPRIPIWVAALGEKNVAMTAEVADGWLPIFFFPEKAKEVFGPSLDAGSARRDPSLGPLQIAAGGLLAIGEESDVAPFRELGRATAALYIGGMGAKGKNFYNALAGRYGYEKEAAEIQDLYLAGHKKEAAAKVPDELLEATSLCGPLDYLRDRLAAMADAGVTHVNVTPIGGDPVAMMEQVRGLL
jgi:F420-dependent oxidoreductase-like protein